MNMKTKLAGLFLGALLATTSAFAADSSTATGKCGGDMKKEMMDKKGASCGTGKCGANMKAETKSGSCGTGKCGGDMKNDMSKMNNDMKDTKKHMKDESKSGSCGTGKCGSK
jgi:uncharacterized low-complexity protein